jgi:hypothetical protein
VTWRAISARPYALDALEGWLERQGEDRTEVERLLPATVAALRPYVERLHSSEGGGGGGGWDRDGGAAGADGPGAGAAYRAGRVAAKRAHAADVEEAGGEGGADGLNTRIVRLLGSVGGRARAFHSFPFTST